MIRSFLAMALGLIMFLVVIVSDAPAQQPGHDACARDVTRFCRAQINDGDQVVLAEDGGDVRPPLEQSGQHRETAGDVGARLLHEAVRCLQARLLERPPVPSLAALRQAVGPEDDPDPEPATVALFAELRKDLEVRASVVTA